MTLTELNEIKQNYKVLDLAVDFINPSYNISRAKHLDTARYIVCTLTENGIPRTIKTNEIARIRLQKPDRTYVYNDCDILEDGRVFITLTEQILAVEGNAVCDIQLTDEETGIIYSTKNFIINIDKTAVDNTVMESTNEFGALNNLIANNKKLNEELNANEEIRQTNEAQRSNNENERQTNETNRQISEDERINAENTRNSNENQRIENENTRQTNETVRQTQETDRENNTAAAISNAEKATKKANDAADDLQNKLNSHHFVLSEDKGIANGVAELDSNGLIPSNQLPSYVDDVIEGYLNDNKFYKDAEHTTEITGETGKIYVDLSSNKTYRWSGSGFAVISETIALGETSSTAYRGDRGKIAYDHSQTVHAPVNAEENQNTFSNVTVGSTAISANSKADTLTFAAGDNITLTPDTENNKITISSTGNISLDNYLPLSGGTISYQDTSKVSFPLVIHQYGNDNSSGWGGGIKFRNANDSEDKWAGIAGYATGNYANTNGLAFYSNATHYMSLVDNVLRPVTNSDAHLGDSSHQWGHVYAQYFHGTCDRAAIAHSLNPGGSNELNFEKTSYWNTAHQLHIGYRWQDGSKAANISGYYFDNGNCELAPVYASKFHGTATNSDRLNGYSASTGTDNNSIARRTENGYLFASRFDQNSSNNENPIISQIMVTNGSDNYFRKASLSHLKTALGNMPPASHTHSYMPLSGGTMSGSPTIKCDGSFYLQPNNSIHIILNNANSASNIYVKSNKSNSNNGYLYFLHDSSSNIYGYMGIRTLGSATQEGEMELILGNSKTVGNTDNATGVIWLYSNTGKAGVIHPNPSQSGNNVIYLPNSGTIATTSSDVRLKENIKDTDVNNALNIVNSIKFRQFDWKETGQHQNIGFIVDELEEIDPHLKLAGTGGYVKDGLTDKEKQNIENMNVKCVDTFYLMGYYGKAIQELYAIIQEQQKELAELKQ